MNPKRVSYIALLLAIIALAFQVESRMCLDRRVEKIVDERERKYCAQLVTNLNISRDFMGSPPVSPKNFAEVLNAYFESINTVITK